jgi:hypothetical protein
MASPRAAAPPSPVVVVLAPGAADNGLATMLASLVRQNLEDKPHKQADFARLDGRVAIVAEDADVALTLEFRRGKLVVHDGIVGIPDVTVRAPSDDVMNLSLIELGRAGLPDVRGESFRKMWRAMREGRVRVYGALAHAPMMLRLARVMSVN